MGPLIGFINHIVGSWGYYAVLGMLSAEGFGLFFAPGETTLIAASIAAGATHRLSIGLVLLTGYAGALLGDNGSFWIGHHFGFELIRRHGHYLCLSQRRIKFVQVVYLRYGIPIVFIGRFIMLFRSWESFLAGANRMRWRRFAPVNAMASLVWVTVWGLGAYALGQSSTTTFEVVGIATFVIFVALSIAIWLFFRQNEERLESWADALLPGSLQPHGRSDLKPVAEGHLVGLSGSRVKPSR